MSGVTAHPFAKSCARIEAASQMGTGYLVTPDRVATCWHVVREVEVGGEVLLKFRNGKMIARVHALNRERDAALIALPRPMDGLNPMRLCGTGVWKAPWDGYGFPAVAGGAGVPLEGVITDYDALDDRDKPAIMVRCEELSAGPGSKAGGFSGGPIVVQGRVVGHLRRIITDPDFKGRPAFGVVWGTPSSAVAEMLGIVLEPASVPPVERQAVPPKLVGANHYHVYVAHGLADDDGAGKKWIAGLVARLEGLGLRVFTERASATPEPSNLDPAQHSLAAIVVSGPAWPAHTDRGSVAASLHRAKAGSGAGVVGVRLSDSEPPGEWTAAPWIDFRGSAGPEGEPFERLIRLLPSGAPASDDRTAAARVYSSESAATDELLAEVRAAAAAGPRRVLLAWEKWVSAGLPAGTAALLVAETLIKQARFQQALQVLKAAGETVNGLRGRQLQALALAKLRREASVEQAIQILQALRDEGALDAETMGLLGGRYKDQWLRTGEERYLLASQRTYFEAFGRSHDPYCGINAAATALQLGQVAEAVRLANGIATHLREQPVEKLSKWDVATLAEALLIGGHLDEARALYTRAVSLEPEAVENIAVMRRGARLTLKALGQDRAELDAVFKLPRVAAFVGHMVDAADRPLARFPESKVGVVRRGIADKLKERNIGYGISSAARGADILFLEELRKRQGHAQVLLPFPPDAFTTTSVGSEWKPQFDDVMNDKAVEITVLKPDAPEPADEPAAFAACNRAIHDRAVEFAGSFDEEPLLLAVWDGQPGDGSGGTADAIRNWRNEGRSDPIVINIKTL